MTKKLTVICTVVFFALMLFLTIFARQIHAATLPKVTAERLDRAYFPFEYTLDDGTTATGSQELKAIPKSLFESGEVYVLYSAEKNGDERSFVRRVEVIVGRESDGYFEVISGVQSHEKVILEHDGELYDGCEVFVE